MSDLLQLKKENRELKAELNEARNEKLIKMLNYSLKRIEEGKFITRKELDI